MDLERNIRVKNRKKNVCNLWLLISCHDQNNCRKIKISKQTEHKIQVEKKKILKNELSTFRSFLLLFHKHTHTKIDGKFKRQKKNICWSSKCKLLKPVDDDGIVFLGVVAIHFYLQISCFDLKIGYWQSCFIGTIRITATIK